MPKEQKRNKTCSLLVIDKTVHEKPFLNELFPLWLFVLQISIVIVRHDDAVRIARQFNNKPIIITDDAPSLHSPRRSEDKDFLFLQLPQDFLIWRRRSCHRLLHILTTHRNTLCICSITYTPVIRASGRDCSFLHAGTNTVMSLCPRSRNQSTANWMPRHEKTSLFPWLQNIPDTKLLRHTQESTTRIPE